MRPPRNKEAPPPGRGGGGGAGGGRIVAPRAPASGWAERRESPVRRRGCGPRVGDGAPGSPGWVARGGSAAAAMTGRPGDQGKGPRAAPTHRGRCERDRRPGGDRTSPPPPPPRGCRCPRPGSLPARRSWWRRPGGGRRPAGAVRRGGRATWVWWAWALRPRAWAGRGRRSRALRTASRRGRRVPGWRGWRAAETPRRGILAEPLGGCPPPLPLLTPRRRREEGSPPLGLRRVRREAPPAPRIFWRQRGVGVPGAVFV